MQSKLVGTWLLSASVGVYGLVSLGAYTRLNKAGLSMVEWKPLSVSYPRTDEDWLTEFEKYKEFPEYKLDNSDIDLEYFKHIYFIEWAHRMLARGMGLWFAVPMGLFWWRGMFTSGTKKVMLGILGLFGCQGLMGWMMVKSGLEEREHEERVKVAPTRLAMHHTFALSIFSLLYWNALNFLRKTPEQVLTTPSLLSGAGGARKRLMGVLHLAIATLVSGSLVAGSDAGRILNNWPFYGEKWFFPEDAWDKEPWYKNFYQNRSMIQFVHRTLAYITYFSICDLYLYKRAADLTTGMKFGINSIMFVGTLQVLLGVTALMRGSPFYESQAHQANSLLLISTILTGLHTVRRPSKTFVKSILNK